MNDIYLISDFHLGHKNILEYEKESRPFQSLDEMEEVIIDNINKTVKETDILWNLGDVMFGGKGADRLDAFMAKIKCKRNYLVCGNHDFQRPSFYMQHGFKWATRYPIMMRDFIWLAHARFYLNKQMPYILIHGHAHSSLPFFDPQCYWYFNVSCEVIGHTPIALEEILETYRKYVDVPLEWEQDSES